MRIFFKTNYKRKQERLDGEIHFSSSSATIYNLVRGLSKPYVGALMMHGRQEVKTWKCEMDLEAPKNHESGKVINIIGYHKVLVKTGNGSIWIIDHEFKSLPNQNGYIV